MQTKQDVDRYTEACSTPFWQKIFMAECDYLMRHLSVTDQILSVGCGPAVIERMLVAHGYSVTGIDVSEPALLDAKGTLPVVTGSAEALPFPDKTFDVVLYIASLQFVDSIKDALEQTARVLKPKGKLLALLLNPNSTFIQERYGNQSSYVSTIKHPVLADVLQCIQQRFSYSGEYYLGIDADNQLNTTSQDPANTALYIVHCTHKSLPIP